MSNWKIEAGKAVWAAGKKFLTSKKGGVEAVSAIKPGTKLPGQKTVKQHKLDVSHKKYIDSIRAAGDQITGNLKKSAEKLKKLNETLKKQKKILDD
jgi:hypothetical protein